MLKLNRPDLVQIELVLDDVHTVGNGRLLIHRLLCFQQPGQHTLQGILVGQQLHRTGTGHTGATLRAHGHHRLKQMGLCQKSLQELVISVA